MGSDEGPRPIFTDGQLARVMFSRGHPEPIVLLGLDSKILVPPGVTIAVHVCPQIEHIPEVLTLSGMCASSFLVHKFEVGRQQVLLDELPLPGEAFIIDDRVQHPPRLRRVVCSKGEDLTLTAENISQESVRLVGLVRGLPTEPPAYDDDDGGEDVPWRPVSIEGR
jgi:hypothetical protein